MKNFVKLLIIIAIVAGACQQKKAEEPTEVEETPKVAALRKDVIAVHDEVMPLMSDIHQLKNALATRLQDSTKLTVEQRKEYKFVMGKLDSANQSMRVWMREFSDVKTTQVPEEEAIANLEVEMKKIKDVKERMLSSLSLGKKLESK